MSTLYQSKTVIATQGGGSPQPLKAAKRSRYPLCNLYPDEQEAVVAATAGPASGLVTTVTNEIGLRFADGSEYRGDIKGKQPHGKGTYIRPDLSYYNGEWANGIAHGVGFEKYADGSTYRGEFVRGKRSGQGAFVGRDYAYEGGWREGKMHGRGVLRRADGQVYTGEMADNFPQGSGCLQFPNGHRYEGDMARGKCQGRGALVLPSGARCVSDWKANVPVNAAVYHDGAGNAVLGQWVNGQFVPKGA